MHACKLANEHFFCPHMLPLTACFASYTTSKIHAVLEHAHEAIFLRSMQRKIEVHGSGYKCWWWLICMACTYY